MRDESCELRVLVVGASGYIGRNFAKYAAEKFTVHTVDSRGGWEVIDFCGYSSVVFAAGIAHRRQVKKNAHLYFAVNRDLALRVAKKAKAAGVPQFIYLSSMAIFGKKEGEISGHTKPKPRNNDYYAVSKFEAENLLAALQDENFAVALVRPPMVIGENCPGKFASLAKIANILPLIPCSKNVRSIIYINTLAEFLCMRISKGGGGIYHPQSGHFSTSRLMVDERTRVGKKSFVFGAKFLLRICGAVLPPIRTAFGSLYYSETIR